MIQRFFVLALLSALALFGADVTGKWQAEVEGRDGAKRTVTFDFKADGDKLTGTMTGGMGGQNAGPRELSDGKISGDDISFVVKVNFQGEERKINYTGKVSGSEIKFKVEGPRAREFTATKVTS